MNEFDWVIKALEQGKKSESAVKYLKELKALILEVRDQAHVDVIRNNNPYPQGLGELIRKLNQPLT